MAATKWGNLPLSVLEVIFSYLDLTDLRNCSLVCKNWYKLLNDENNDVWRMHCIRKLAEEALRSDILSSVPTYKAKLRAFYHAWDPNECSRNVYIKPNGFTLHRNPVAQSTDAAKGKIGFRTGRHCWEVWWEGPLGTVAVIGIATKEAPVQCPGYVALLGSNSESWGWNLVDNHLLHNGDSQGNYPQLNNAPKYQYKTVNLAQKLEVVHEVEQGLKKKAEIEKDFGIPPNTLSTYLKNKEKFLNSWTQYRGEGRKRVRGPDSPDVDESMV